MIRKKGFFKGSLDNLSVASQKWFYSEHFLKGFYVTVSAVPLESQPGTHKVPKLSAKAVLSFFPHILPSFLPHVSLDSANKKQLL